MKKIVPFNNVLTFNTDVCDITAISLEHSIKTEESSISGVFYISGEYKITDGQLEKDTFNFELPFDIALGSDYNLDTLVVDIDDFRYELIDRNKLKVNIDLYIDGEITMHPIVVEEPLSENEELAKDEPIKEDRSITDESTDNEEPKEKKLEDNKDESINISKEKVKETKETKEEPTERKISENIDILDKMLKDSEEPNMKETEINIENNNNNNNDINIFNGFNDEEKYVTYRVYRVLDTDTIDKIIEKYNTSKEELAKYNNIEEIKPGDKLIIPANDK